MFSKRNLSRGELILFGGIIMAMILFSYIPSGFKLDVGLIPLSIGISYLIKAIDPGPEYSDERDKLIISESFKWMLIGLYTVWTILYFIITFTSINIAKELYIIIPMSFCIIVQSISEVVFRKFIM